MIKIGANYVNGHCEFTVWAPEKDGMELILTDEPERKIAMEKNEEGYFKTKIAGLPPGIRYRYQPKDSDRSFPDPASNFQPEGVHGVSEVVDHQAYAWKDQLWKGLPLKELIFYEIHVGTFTNEGTFEAIIPLLPQLKEVGVNVIELMPVAQFPGDRNWGYDAVYPLAVQDSYGGPTKLKELVDAAHANGIAVFLDVVFNHLGPEGNYFEHFGPYFTSQYKTPWGNAINLDGEWSDGVRNYFSYAIGYWYENFHIDGLRVDAAHMMYDNGSVHFWEKAGNDLELLRQQLGRSFYLIAESDLNSPKVVKSPDNGGWGFDAQWLDDFHHSLYVLLDENGKERYEDFGQMEHLAKAYSDGFVHSGEYVKFRKRKHGSSSVGLPGTTFVVFNQNHDQVGNRVGGERLSMLISEQGQKVAAAAILLAPYLPMLFMGEEFAADTPFFYFISHSEEELIRMVVEGRQKEFANYQWDVPPPNPQEKSTFQQSKLNWELRSTGKHLDMLNWHKELIRLRRSNPAFTNFNKNEVRVNLFGEKGLVLYRQCADHLQQIVCIFNLGNTTLTWPIPALKNRWKKLLDSGYPSWMDGGETVGSFSDLFEAGQLLSINGLSVMVFEGVD